jgi:hypothetical protein
LAWESAGKSIAASIMAMSRVGLLQINASEAAGVARLQNSGGDAVPVHAGREREGKSVNSEQLPAAVVGYGRKTAAAAFKLPKGCAAAMLGSQMLRLS